MSVERTKRGSDARNHHFVPQFYLKGFAKLRSKDAKLTAFNLATGELFVTRPRNVAAKRDYNRVDIEASTLTSLKPRCPRSRATWTQHSNG
jgi:Protein of unknown function (DUF4238)